MLARRVLGEFRVAGGELNFTRRRSEWDEELCRVVGGEVEIGGGGVGGQGGFD